MRITDNKQYEFRKKTDVLFESNSGKTELYHLLKKYVDFVTEHQLYNEDLWNCFREQFVLRNDSETGSWRGEFFGKVFRGGCFIYKITKDNKLYKILKKNISELIKTQDNYGRITSYSQTKEFFGWDLWTRKYVMLAIEYFLEISEDEKLNELLLKALIKHADYIVSRIGEDKINILDTSTFWGGLNSASILEPFVKLYCLTREKRFLDFATYIINTGGCKNGDVIKTALENIKIPCEYPVVKAYELTSFFDGVAEYYSCTGIEKYKTAVINFADKIIENEFTVIGCSGCTHELFDNSSQRQTEDQIEVMQETCVTVTLMKYLIRVYELNGDPKYADCIERSYYNAMLGSVNRKKNDELFFDKETGHFFDYSDTKEFVKQIHGLTFDSYSPLYKKARCRMTGGYQKMTGNKCYGCCSAIGALGISVVPLYSVMESNDGLVFNFLTYEKKTAISPEGQTVDISVKTAYPYGEKAIIKIRLEKAERFVIKIRIPDHTDYAVIDGEKTAEKGLYSIEKEWHDNTFTVEFISSLKTTELNGKISFVHGAIVYGADNRYCSLDKKVTGNITDYKIAHNYINDSEKDYSSEININFSNGETVKLIDYSSCGSIWKNGSNKVSVWLDKDKEN